MRVFQLDQPSEQPVVLGVRDRRVVEDIVAIVVLVQDAAQLVDLARRCRYLLSTCHTAHYSHPSVRVAIGDRHARLGRGTTPESQRADISPNVS